MGVEELVADGKDGKNVAAGGAHQERHWLDMSHAGRRGDVIDVVHWISLNRMLTVIGAAKLPLQPFTDTGRTRAQAVGCASTNHIQRFEFAYRFRGRTRTRTLDPLIKSQRLIFAKVDALCGI
jgi:hypothetical protein